MATSGKTNFNQTRNEIIKAALLKCRVTAEGEDETAEMIKTGTRELNSIIKFWQAQGYHLWKTPEAYIFLEHGKDVYKLGTDGDLATEEVNKTKLAFHAYKGTNQIYLMNTPAVGDYIGIEMPVGLWWSTVAEVDDHVVTLADLLPCNACPCAKVFYFTKKISRPLKILEAKRVNLDGYGIPMNALEREQFFKLTKSHGVPLNYNYTPTNDLGTLSIWPTPLRTDHYIKIIYEQAFDVFENSKDSPDVAQEWIEPLTWELAYRMAANFGLDIQEREWLKAQAKETLEDAKRFDAEVGSFYLQLAQYGGAY